MDTSGSLKKLMKWMGIAIVTPILLFLALAVLLYCPPVQNWAVQRVTATASEKLGLEVSVGHVNLEWPLDLGIDHLTIIQPPAAATQHLTPDTLASIGHVTVDVQLRPLLSKRVVINELSISQAQVNTDGFISDLQVRGDIGELWLRSRGIDLDRETVEVNGARLADAQLDIALSDTAAVDTTTSEARWRVNADSLTISRTSVALHLPGDTMHVTAYMGLAVARQADIDIGQSTYRVESFDWHDGRLSYDNHRHPASATNGLDTDHISLTAIRLGVDSIYYGLEGTRLHIRQTAMKEQSGLEITQLTGRVLLDTAFNHIELPHLTLRTPDSDIEAEAYVDVNALTPATGRPVAGGDDRAPGTIRARLNAQIGKQDLVRFAGPLPQQFIRQYPNHPLSIKGSVNGNSQRLEVTGVDIALPTALHASADGYAYQVTDPERLRGQLTLKAETHDLGFITTLAEKAQFRLPPLALDATVKADGLHYDADLTLREGSGTMKAKTQLTATSRPSTRQQEGGYEMAAYLADVTINELDLSHFLPHDSIYTLSATAKVKGSGTDLTKKSSQMEADIAIGQLQYGQWHLDSIKAVATLRDGHAIATVDSHNPLFDGTADVDATLSGKDIEATVLTAITRADIYRLRLSSHPLAVGLRGKVELGTDTKQCHHVKGLLTNLYIKDEKGTYHPEDFGIYAKTDADTTYVRLQSGDLILKFDAQGGYERLISQGTTLLDSAKAQFEAKRIDQPHIKQLLPTMRVYLTSGRNNPVANILRTKGIVFKDLFVNLNTSAVTGVNGQAHLHSLDYDSTKIDTVKLQLTQKGDRLTYQGQVCNNRRNPQFVFNALFDGTIHEHGALVGLRYYDDKGRMGVRLGATAQMEAGGLRFRLMPERPTIGYKEFNLNKDNYIFMGSDKRLYADVELIADDKTGLKIYTIDAPATETTDTVNAPTAITNLQDLTVSLNRFNLDEFTSVLPYVPRMSGLLNGDFHIVQDHDERISVASDLTVLNMAYEGSPIGNLSSELTYLQREDDSHAVEARLMLDEEEFGLFEGSIRPQGATADSQPASSAIDATFTMTRLPLSLVNGFVTDQIIGLDGYSEGTIAIKGTLQKPVVDGEVYLDSAYLVSVPYGVRLRFDNDPVRIVGSHLLLENFGLYAYNDQPLNMQGDIDFTDTGHVTIDLRMRARDYQVINAKQEPKSIAFGKAFVNFFARLTGPVEQMKMRGRLDVLGSTDMTYMLLDSPLSTDNRLDELVKFTDFSDSTQTVVTRPTPSGLDVDLTLSVSQGAHIVCDLNAEQTNYIDLMGGGDLRLRYNQDGIGLTGRYTLASGEMKYSLPVIPLKTFTIKDGSYVEFTGDATNPRLSITATERTKASVGSDGGSSRSVAFDCGVIITRTLNDMGLQFIIEAPEDMTVNGELQSMSVEERGKLAVTMLTTGMYLADGNTGSFSMNSALSSFLQSEINSIAGSALKTLDLQVGVDNTTDASGDMHTDYSFKFAKRFLNNRLKIQLGGKVSSGAEVAGQKQSFFDNVTMEYRLNQEGTQNLKLFYMQNVYDWLDGYTGEYGGGFVWRRKLQDFWSIFTFWKNEQRPMMMRQQTAPADSTGRTAPSLQARPENSVNTDSTRHETR